MQDKRVTMCACASRHFVDKDKVLQIAMLLENNGFEVRIEPDLCKAIMQKDRAMEEIASSTILACYPRAVQSLLATMALVPKQLLDIRNEDIPTVLGQIGIDVPVEGECVGEKDNIRQQIESFPVEEGTDAWYPTLDKERCTECGKCHDFCLFGVYTIENKQVKVVNPQNCKNNCPACARMCPSRAIIFPKYEKSPINGGLAEEEQFNPNEMDKLYKERLRYRLQQRRASVPLIKDESK